MSELYLQHHGILGQKWGVRRYQNPDGSLTKAGQKRYNKLDSYRNKHIERNRKEIEEHKQGIQDSSNAINDIKKNGVESKALRDSVDAYAEGRAVERMQRRYDEAEEYITWDDDLYEKYIKQERRKIMKDLSSFMDLVIYEETRSIEYHEKEISRGEQFIKDLENMKIDYSTHKSSIRKIAWGWK